jgi:hypothetical protein
MNAQPTKPYHASGHPEGYVTQLEQQRDELRAALEMALVQIQQDNDERKVPSGLRGTEYQARAAIANATGP